MIYEFKKLMLVSCNSFFFMKNHIFVDLEQAKMLRDLGFNDEVIREDCIGGILQADTGCTCYFDPLPKEYIKIPTLEQAYEWIMKNYESQVLDFKKDVDLSLFYKDESEILSVYLSAISED